MTDILVIDDLRTFRFDAVYARTLAEADALLADRPWREVWLDFDMGLVAGSDTTAGIADRLAERAAGGSPLPVGRFVVHTANPVGRVRLVGTLRPFYAVVEVVANDHLAAGSPRLVWRGGA